MTGEQWKIYWNEYSADTYLYGAKINYHSKDDVEFSDELMPPGTIIKRWYSKTNFQLQRVEPSLPMIDGESSYRLLTDVDSDEEEGCLFRLVFFDKYGTEAGQITVRDPVTDFQCPLKTYSYELQLINGGVKHFHFHSITICEVIDEGAGK
jgi:accessory secretory protein Asp3